MLLISPNFDVKSVIFSQFCPRAFSQNCWKKPWWPYHGFVSGNIGVLCGDSDLQMYHDRVHLHSFLYHIQIQQSIFHHAYM